LMAARVLVTDDDPAICEVLVDILAGLGHEADCAHTAAETLKAVAAGDYAVVLLDLNLPDCKDLSLLATLRQQHPATDVIMVTAQVDDFGLVAQATRLGAFDYVPKPIRKDDICIRLTRVLEMRALARGQTRAVTELARGREFDDIVGDSAAIRSAITQARDLGGYDIPVLITGETGTGKELIARALHYGSPRRSKPFVAINCAALPAELTESELFGHEKGAFTGAHAYREGAFQEAEDGTLFLDEIGDMPLQSQAALLHVLERGEYRSVGGKTKTSQARLVFASNMDIEKLIHEGGFRKDLYYRINRVRIVVPPLRDRKEDIPPLAEHFLKIIEAKVGKSVRSISPDAAAALQSYLWPGNVRELRNEVERAYLHTDEEVIRPLDLSPEVLANRVVADGTTVLEPASLEELLKLAQALRDTGGSISKTASALGVHRNTVRRWMKKYSLSTN
jgi:two-component system response regulator AtoC